VVQVRIITLKHLKDAAENYPDAEEEIRAWTTIVGKYRWRDFVDVRQTFTDASYVDGYTIFNFGWNRYRLITFIHYSRTENENANDGRVYIRSFLTHKEYDNRNNWDRRYGK
jgi:mRNA interferase HigB